MPAPRGACLVIARRAGNPSDDHQGSISDLIGVRGITRTRISRLADSQETDAVTARLLDLLDQPALRTAGRQTRPRPNPSINRPCGRPGGRRGRDQTPRSTGLADSREADAAAAGLLDQPALRTAGR